MFLPVGMATTRGEDTLGKYCPQVHRSLELGTLQNGRRSLTTGTGHFFGDITAHVQHVVTRLWGFTSRRKSEYLTFPLHYFNVCTILMPNLGKIAY